MSYFPGSTLKKVYLCKQKTTKKRKGQVHFKHLYNAETNINTDEHKGVSNLLSSRLCGDTLELLPCSGSAEFDFHASRAHEMALTQNLSKTQYI